MTEFHEYLERVIWYCHHEYETPLCSIEDFYNSPNSNIWLNLIFNNYLEDKSFQECSFLLMDYYKSFMSSVKE